MLVDSNTLIIRKFKVLTDLRVRQKQSQMQPSKPSAIKNCPIKETARFEKRGIIIAKAKSKL